LLISTKLLYYKGTFISFTKLFIADQINDQIENQNVALIKTGLLTVRKCAPKAYKIKKIRLNNNTLNNFCKIVK